MTHEELKIFVHDLRSPLSGIRMQASMLVSGDYGELSEDAKKASQLIQDAAEKALALIESGLTDEKT